jgi:sugar lactone lactonase YvrE
MEAQVTETKFRSVRALTARIIGMTACLGAVILICSSASAENLFVTAYINTPNSVNMLADSESGDLPNDGSFGAIAKFTWDGKQSIFASGLTAPADLVFDDAGNLFLTDCSGCFTPRASLIIYKVTPAGVWTTFARETPYHTAYLAADNAGDLFVADYEHGVINRYKPSGARSTFATALYHPVGMVCDSAGNLYVADNSAGNLHQGGLYKYASNGSRVTLAALSPLDRPSDLALDSMGNLLMADLGGNVYKYYLSFPLPRQGRTIFGSVPNSARSIARDSANNLFVLDAGDANGNGNTVYKFSQGVRAPFAPGTIGESFLCLAVQPMACCEGTYSIDAETPAPRARPTPAPRPVAVFNH